MQALSPLVEQLIEIAIVEDQGAAGDVTTRVLGLDGRVARATIEAKEPLVLAGVEVACLVFERVDRDLAVAVQRKDGDALVRGDGVLVVEGDVRSILAAERPALNFLQRLSGIATTTRRYVEAVAGTRARILDTRKTAPGFRALDKAAVRAGGGMNHRQGLGDGILIKNNHIAAVGGVGEAVRRARRNRPPTHMVEVEVESEAQLREALEAGAEAVLLDNRTPEELRWLVQIVAGRAITEASGGVTLATVADIAHSGVDFISVGALTHSPRAADLHLVLSEPEGAIER